jgi:hypothetical protein
MRLPEVSMRRHFAGQQQIDVRHDLRIHDHPLRPQGGLPVAIWPYEPYIDAPLTSVAPTGSEAAPAPQIIIVQSDNPARFTPPKPEAPLDFSYVPACRAIPNGYHCGAPEGATSLNRSATTGGDARGGAVGFGGSE